jgi:glycosyltransferase involved in cell wall biosynthesis
MIEGKTGWIVERDAKAIAFAIAQGLQNRPHVAAMGQAARQRSLEYDEQAFRSRWGKLLEKAWAEEG